MYLTLSWIRKVYRPPSLSAERAQRLAAFFGVSLQIAAKMFALSIQQHMYMTGVLLFVVTWTDVYTQGDTTALATSCYTSHQQCMHVYKGKSKGNSTN